MTNDRAGAPEVQEVRISDPSYVITLAVRKRCNISSMSRLKQASPCGDFTICAGRRDGPNGNGEIVGIRWPSDHNHEYGAEHGEEIDTSEMPEQLIQAIEET